LRRCQDDKKSKKKDKDGSDEDKKSKKKDKKKSKKKEKEGEDTGKWSSELVRQETTSFRCSQLCNAENGSEKDYIKEAMFGKKEDDEFGSVEDDDVSLASEAGIDDSGARQLAVEAVRKFLEEKPEASADELVEVVTNQQMSSALKSQDKVYILVSAAISPNFFKKKEVAKYAKALVKITNNNKIMERHLIATLEAISIDKPKNFPVLIKQFYDEDALAEETILEWADGGRSEYTLDVVDEETRAVIRGEAEPVVVWLQEADSEEDSDEDDESD